MSDTKPTQSTPAPAPAKKPKPRVTLQSILHGIARLFTIPRDQRQQLAANPIVSIAKPVAEGYAKDALYNTLRINLTPAEADAAIGVLDPAIDATGVFK